MQALGDQRWTIHGAFPQRAHGPRRRQMVWSNLQGCLGRVVRVLRWQEERGDQFTGQGQGRLQTADPPLRLKVEEQFAKWRRGRKTVQAEGPGWMRHRGSELPGTWVQWNSDHRDIWKTKAKEFLSLSSIFQSEVQGSTWAWSPWRSPVFPGFLCQSALFRLHMVLPLWELTGLCSWEIQRISWLHCCSQYPSSTSWLFFLIIGFVFSAKFFPKWWQRCPVISSKTHLWLQSFWKDSISFSLVSMKFQEKEPHWPQLCHMFIYRSVTHGQEDELFSLDSLESRANSFGQGWSHFPLLLTMSSRGSAIHEKLGCCLPSGQWMQGRRKQALPLIQLHPSRLTPQMCALCRGHHPCCQDDNCLNLAGPQFLLWPSPLLPEQHTHLFHLERILWRVFWG